MRIATYDELKPKRRKRGNSLQNDIAMFADQTPIVTATTILSRPQMATLIMNQCC
jgi:hypothetical protein